VKKWILCVSLAACSGGKSDADYAKDLPQDMHDSIEGDLVNLQAAARALQAAAPTPSGRGWDATLDADAITAMKAAWTNTRTAYEHVEGATAPIFGDLDFSMDARYDDALAELGSTGDADAFDSLGFTGMHAIERILYSDQIPQRVVAFESTLPGYTVAQFPQTEAEAMEFKAGLAQRLVDDADSLQSQWQPAAIDIGLSFQGLVSLMNEQKEKVDKASTGEEESRYAQTTLFDLRNNLEGTMTIYALFEPWLLTKTGGSDDDTMIEAGFATLSTLYDNDPGDAIPTPPDDWSSDAPTTSDQQTPFGLLWEAVHAAVDPTTPGSVVYEMNDVATKLGFPQFVEGN
jgi:iron uptake system component EfeO